MTVLDVVKHSNSRIIVKNKFLVFDSSVSVWHVYEYVIDRSGVIPIIVTKSENEACEALLSK